MTHLRSYLFTVLTCVAGLLATMATAQDFDALVASLPDGNFDDRAAVVGQIAASGDDRAVGLLEALSDGELQVLKSDGRLVIVTDVKGVDIAADALTGAEAGVVPRRGASAIRVNNSLRRTIGAAIGILTLSSPDPARRLTAAEAAFRAPDPDQLDLLQTAILDETDPRVSAALKSAIAATTLAGDSTVADKLAAIAILKTQANQAALGILTPLVAAPDAQIAAAAADAVDQIERTQKLWSGAQNVLFGISLGSVLLLAAIGLAITFGVMGVINMAHGELVMIGAYTTFAVQEVIRNSFPFLFDWSLLIAAPLAFLMAGAVGVAIERGCVRFLYGRPLETLLATWGVSLILQQTVRSIFGPNNREVGNPSWMSGAFDIGHLTITYNRLWIFVFALAVFAILLFVMKKTPIGLQMRAVTQNRAMAASMGIRTGWVDAMTFGLGAGIAGLAGVALSQIDNVSPNLGQSYIVDSFMVVVFGGAGNIWGTLAGAFSIGIANKFLEPYSGAVLAKIIVLVCIILFIQKRPRGLFAVKGRAVDG
ncbi:urea ABC transporter permease subunit UrtB [Pseudoruegeria sp. SK021]|uniref:urea ABC transporter permease subunit UrtB n=1 Tax=Pseudoruegeria sp. SK021 TaxID=1933035 RepID=UPI000A25E038|nr:urea ABC transporter permease subunit UrtB [Pseudoruegeria sp. SK021]OSP56642.1 urea ABC transporter permease subunit UrtB [Pseudoruegeria sp. SK021]